MSLNVLRIRQSLQWDRDRAACGKEAMYAIINYGLPSDIVVNNPQWSIVFITSFLER